MKLALRDRVAEWILEALESPDAAEAVRALGVFAREADEEGRAPLPPDLADTLCGAEEIFERVSGGARLREAFCGDLPALRNRVGRVESALGTSRARCRPTPDGDSPTARAGAPPDARQIEWLLCAAGALFDTGLYFEVHELLEPAWGRSSGDLRVFLQGLIQIAVGLHHHENGNLRGALSLLHEGKHKLQAQAKLVADHSLTSFAAALAPLEQEVARQLEHATPAPLPIPAFPHPDAKNANRG